MTIEKNPRDLVLAYVSALNHENFVQAKRHISDDFAFEGVLGSRKGADSYIGEMEHMRLKYDLKKVFVDGNDVCLWYNVTLSGTPVLTAGWYHVEAGKISSLNVVFDPRPVLAGKAA